MTKTKKYVKEESLIEILRKNSRIVFQTYKVIVKALYIDCINI